MTETLSLDPDRFFNARMNVIKEAMRMGRSDRLGSQTAPWVREGVRFLEGGADINAITPEDLREIILRS